MFGFFKGIIIPVSLLISPILAIAQWNPVSIGYSDDLYAISFSGSKIHLGGVDSIFSSSNGTSWTGNRIENSLGQGLWMTGIYDQHFTSGSTGYVVGLSYLGNSEVIYQTTNGGNNWTPVSINNLGPWPRYLNDLEFVNSSIGFATGTNGRILKTTNGGTSWNGQNSGTTENLYEAKFLNVNKGFAVGNKILLSTTNGGSSWSSQAYTVNLRSISFVNGTNGYIATDSFLLKTGNGGSTWDTLHTPFYFLSQVVAISTDTLIVSTRFDGVFISRNGGQLWEYFPSLKNVSLSDIRFDGAIGYAVGNDGKVFRTTNKGGSSAPMAMFDYSITEDCGKTTVHLVNKGSLHYSYQWFHNSTPLSTGRDTSFDFSQTTYGDTFKLVAYNGYFYDTAYRRINVAVTLPVNAYAGDDLRLCFGNSGILNGSGGTSFYWSPSTGLNNSLIAKPKASPSSTTTYTLITSSGACSDTDSVTVYVDGQIAANNWDSLNTLQTWPLRAISFPSRLRGYSVSRNGELLRTTDGGENWTKTTPFSWNQDFTGMHFVNDAVGYVASQVIYKTTDYGSNWTKLNNTPFGGYFGTLWFTDANNGFIVGNGQATFRRYLCRTTNGGSSWTLQLDTTMTNRLNQIMCVDANTCYCVGGYFSNSAIILKTVDAGQHWNPVTLPTPRSEIWGVDFWDLQNGIAVGSDGYVYRTEDGGDTWDVQQMPSYSNHLRAVKYVTADTVFAGGFNKGFFKSVNGGKCWENMGDITEGSIMDIEFPNPGVGYLAGSVGNFGDGTIYKTGADSFLYFSISNPCQGEVINPRNESFGYSNYKWLLNGVDYATSFDTAFLFQLTGQQTISIVGFSGSSSDTFSTVINVYFTPAKAIKPIGPDSICAGTTSTVFKTFGVNGASYEWVIEPSSAASLSNSGDSVLVSWNNLPAPYTGWAYLRVRTTGSGQCFGLWSDSLAVFVEPVPARASQPVGDSIVCRSAGTFIYKTSPVQDAKGYMWNLNPDTAGTLIQINDSVQVVWNPAFYGKCTLTVEAVNAQGCSEQTSPVLEIWKAPEMPKPHSINGPDSVCQGTAGSIFRTLADTAFSAFNWYVSPSTAGTVAISGDSMVVNWDSSFYGDISLFVTGQSAYLPTCESEPSDSFFVSVVADAFVTTSPSGPDTACSLKKATYHLPFTSAQAQYLQWALLPSTSGTLAVSGDSVQITWNAGYSRSVKLFAIPFNELNCSGIHSDTIEILVIVPPSRPAKPFGKDTVCGGLLSSVYRSLGFVGGALKWEIIPPMAGSIIPGHDSAIVSWNPAYSGKAGLWVVHQGTGGCDSEPSDTIEIYVQNSNHLLLTPLGADTVCENGNGQVYRVPAAFLNTFNLSWQISPANAATLTQYGDSVLVSWMTGFSGIARLWAINTVTNCGSQNTDTLDIFARPLPGQPAIPSGPTSVCTFKDKGVTSFYLPGSMTNVSGYTWNLDISGAGTVTGNDTAKVQWSYFEGKAGLRVTAVNNCGTGASSAPLMIQLSKAPAIINGPSNISVKSGDSVTFSATIEGTSPITYKWLKNSNPIPGATGNPLIIYPVSGADSGIYRVIAENYCGLDTSVDAKLSVSGNTGIQEGNWEFLISPNPTSGMVYFNVPDRITSDCTVMDLMGNVILKYKLEPGLNQQINLSGLAAGVYLLKVDQKGKVYWARVIIIRE